MLQISFAPFVDDGFDDDRCGVVIDTGEFRGESRYTNKSPKEFAELAAQLGQFPLRKRVQHKWFDGLLTMDIEPIDDLGTLRLQLSLSEEIDCNMVSIDGHVDYIALERFAGELATLIERDYGEARL